MKRKGNTPTADSEPSGMSVITRSPIHRKPVCLLVIIIMILLTLQSHAEITTDGTLGPALNLSGPDFRIGHELGTTIGGNLFHSFDRFNIHPGQSATFTGPDTLDTVISRVTGGNVSTIDGPLRSEIGTADFYFINPAGVIFGPNARVDVPAAFHVSTADEIRFSGGSVFSATSPEASTLTAATPESFGYLGPRAASLVVNGSNLEFAAGNKVSLIGGDVIIAGTKTDAALLKSPGGELRIYAAGNQSDEVPLTGNLKPGAGRLEVTHARVESSGEAGGKMRIGAGEANVTDATIAANNTGATPAAGGVDIAVAGALELNAAQIQSNAFGAGASGGVRINARELTITQQEATTLTGLFSEVEPGAQGSSGGIAVNVSGAVTMRGAVGIAASCFGDGNAGDVSVHANTVDMDGKGAIVTYRDSQYVAGIDSEAGNNSSGSGGNVLVEVAGRFSLTNNGDVSTSTNGAGDAGSVTVSARELLLDGGETGVFTGISTNANFGSLGNAGTVTISVTDLLEVLNGGQISSSTFGAGDAGGVEIKAGNLRIDGRGINGVSRISSDTVSSFPSSAGTVTINVTDLLEIVNGGQISSSTFGAGNAGGVEIKAGNLRIDGQGISGSAGIFGSAEFSSSGNAGTVTISVADLLEVLNGGVILGSTYAAGNAGGVEIDAGSLRIDGREAQSGGIASQAYSGSAGNAGAVTIRVADFLEVLNGGQISSDTYASGDAGGVTIHAGTVRIDRETGDFYARISSDANYGSIGNAGKVTIVVKDLLEILGGATLISSDTSGAGNAGTVTVEAGKLRIDAQGTGLPTGIRSQANPGASGNAGTVTISVADLLEVLNGGQISSSTFGAGVAGGVGIKAARLHVDGRGISGGSRISSDTVSGFPSNAGMVTISVADLLEVLNGGQISSSTFGAGNAEGVKIKAGNLRIDGQGISGSTGIFGSAELSSSGNAGTVTINVAGLLEVLNGGVILGSTYAAGNAGGVEIDAGNLRIDGREAQSGGIVSQAFSGSSGNAGSVAIGVSGLLEVLNGGSISSSTFAKGDAGSVNIHAGELLIDGHGGENISNINSISGGSAQGFSGNVDIAAGKLTARNGGTISIETHQIVSEEKLLGDRNAHLIVTSPVVILDQGAEISAQSWGNVPAAAIGITADTLRISGNSQITTAAIEADGGPITLQGDIIDLRDSLITSSVEGLTGDGGNITITGADAGKAVILTGGFIQANAPAGARGGDIFIDTKAVIPEGGALEIGGQERQRFAFGSGKNIIQAAAPGGEKGTIQITSPELDISGSLVNLDARLIETIRLAADPCRTAVHAEGSSLVFAGAGGIPSGPDQHAALFFDENRLDKLSVPDAEGKSHTAP